VALGEMRLKVIPLSLRIADVELGQPFGFAYEPRPGPVGQVHRARNSGGGVEVGHWKGDWERQAIVDVSLAPSARFCA